MEKDEAGTKRANASRSYPMRSYTCGTCGGPHPTKRFPTTNPLKWCDVCQKMTNNETKNCYYQLRAKSKERLGQVATFERPKPVLGDQPPLLGTTRVRMVEFMEYNNQLVSSIPYGDEGYYTYGIYEEDLNQSLMIMGMRRGRTLDAFTRRNPISNGTCY